MSLKFMYGTAWKEENTEKCVLDAVAAGFRAIDTANQRKHYFEAGVGAALSKVFLKGEIKRQDIFLQTKFTYQRGQDSRLPYDPSASLRDQVAQSFTSSLEHLQTNYIDSYVLHGPSNSSDFAKDDWEVWEAMEEIKKRGKVKVLGVSNVNLRQLRTLCENTEVKPAYVQNRCYARLGWDKDVREYCLKEGITYQGFSLLTANQEIFHISNFLEIMQRVHCTAAQLVFKFSTQVGMLPLTGTTDPVHMKEDLESSKVELSSSDVHVIETLLL